MSRAVRDHIRSNIVGYLALFIALSATAYALPRGGTIVIKRGQVKTRNLAASAVTGSKLAPNSVDSSKVLDNSLTGADINESTLNLPSQPTALPPIGPAGGDLSGQFPDPQVQESGLTAGGDLSGPLSNAVVDTSKLAVGGGLTGTVANAGVDTSKLNTGGDLTGTVSNTQIGANAVGDAEIADRTANFSVPVQQLLPLVGRAGTTATATDIPTSSIPALSFADGASQQVEFTLQVPSDRAATSSLTIAIEWSSTSTGLADWRLDYLPATTAVNGAFKNAGSGGTTNFSANSLTVDCCMAIPSADLQNGLDIAVKLTRLGTDPSDSLSAPARVESIDFSYTAKR